MPSPLLTSLTRRIQDGLRPLAGPLTHRIVRYYTVKLATTAPIGATSLTLTGLPAGFDRVLPGDTLQAPARSFTDEVLAVGGTITAAPLSVALTAQLSAGAALSIGRRTETTVQGWTETAAAAIAVNVTVVTGDIVFCILTDSMPTPPALDTYIVDETGKARMVKNVVADAMNAVWRVTAVS